MLGKGRVDCLHRSQWKEFFVLKQRSDLTLLMLQNMSSCAQSL